jgi:hypothetical protein
LSFVAPPIGEPSRYHWLPVALLEVSVTLSPAQKVVGPLALIVGVDGIGFTTTVVDPAAEVQPLTVTVTLYVPAVVPVGFCNEEVKPPGPVHAYVAPVTVGVESWIVAPAQYGPPLLAVGVAGIGLTTTVVEPAADVQPLTVTVTLYVPAVVPVGFCSDEVKPPGPVHAYVAPVTVGVESWIVAPVQYGPPFDAVGVEGIGFTTTAVEPAAEVQPFTVTVTSYVPASVAVGFCSDEVKPFGPVHKYVAPVTVGVER